MSTQSASSLSESDSDKKEGGNLKKKKKGPSDHGLLLTFMTPLK